MILTAISYPNNEIDYSIDIDLTTYSNELIQYLWVDLSEAVTDTYVEIEYNSVITTLLITDECRYTPVDIAFQNKEGAMQILTFFKAKKDSISVSSQNYEGNNGQGKHQFNRFNVQAREKFTVNSGFVVEDRNEAIRQLLLSERVWLIGNGEGTEVPLNVSSSSLEYKTRQNDRLINYAIDFEYAFNVINNI